LHRAGIAALFVGCWTCTCLAQELPVKNDLDIESIVAAGVLRVAITKFDLPSFHRRRADGKIVGPEVDLAQQVADALKVKLMLISDASSFDGVIDAVAKGGADIGISKLSQTYYRLMRVRFSQPYLTLRHGLIFDRAAVARLAAGRPPDGVLRVFAGSIGVIAGSAYVDFARRNFPAARVVEMPNWTAVVDALKAQRVDAVYRDEFEIKRVLKINPALNVKFGAAVMTDQFAFLSIAICNSCSKLQEFINYHLAGTRGAFNLNALLSAESTD
jgi:ABC-type amino acid transport substrate-binding protein